MAYFTKDVYDRKANYAAVKNAESAEIAIDNGMTSEQAEAMKRLCAIRHYIHSNYNDYYSSEGATAQTINDYIRELEVIQSILKDLDVPLFHIGDIDEVPNDSCFEFYLEDGEDRYDDEVVDRIMNDILNEISEYFNKLNGSIEKFLSDVDEKYNTSFCPTGYARGQF